MKIVDYRGVDNLYAAEVLVDDNETGEGHGYKTDEPFEVAGVATISKSTSNDSATKHYNNLPAIVISGTSSDEVQVSCSVPDLATYAKLMGQGYDAARGLLVEGERADKYFALGYRTKDTSGNYRYVWRLKGKFSVPDEESNTEDEGTDSNGIELTYTGISTIHKFNSPHDTPTPARSVIVSDAEDKADVSKWFEAVQTPDTITAKDNSGT